MKENEIPRLPFVRLEHLLERPIKQGAAFLIRHAERPPLTGPETILYTDLSEKGRKDARSFGSELVKKYSLCGVYCSPVNRCINTGIAVIEGAQASLIPQVRWWLFSPFLKGQESNGRCSIKINSTTVPDMGVASLSCNSLQTVIDRIKIPTSPGMLNLYITHDSTVTPATGFLMGLDVVWVNQYPQYLEGVVLIRDGSGKTGIHQP